MLITNSVFCFLLECLQAYKKANGVLPDTIILYRNGVGEGQIQYVIDCELDQMRVLKRCFLFVTEPHNYIINLVVRTRSTRNMVSLQLPSSLSSLSRRS